MGIRAFEILVMGMMFFPQCVAVSTAAAQTEPGASPIQMQSDIPSVYQTLGDYFPVGSAIWSGDLSGIHAELLVKHFNSIVAANAMKMSAEILKYKV